MQSIQRTDKKDSLVRLLVITSKSTVSIISRCWWNASSELVREGRTKMTREWWNRKKKKIWQFKASHQFWQPTRWTRNFVFLETNFLWCLDYIIIQLLQFKLISPFIDIMEFRIGYMFDYCKINYEQKWMTVWNIIKTYIYMTKI